MFDQNKYNGYLEFEELTKRWQKNKSIESSSIEPILIKCIF